MAEDRDERSIGSILLSPAKIKRKESSSCLLVDLTQTVYGPTGRIVARYICGCAGTSSKPVRIVPNDQPTEGDHIRCLSLREDEYLDELLEKYHKIHASGAKALIVVNTRDDFDVKHAPLLSGASDLPVFVLKANDGMKLISLLAMESSAGLYGEVVVESFADVGQLDLSVTDEVASAQDATVAWFSKSQSGLGRGTLQDIKKQRVGDKIDDIKSQIKRLMFCYTNITPISLTEHPGTFEILMSIFQRYEKSTRGDGRHEKALTKLQKGIDSGNRVFEKDFPFYIILAYRISKFKEVYGGEASRSFIKLCLSKTVALDATLLASTMDSFAQSNCVLMFGDDTNEHALQLLEDACLKFASFTPRTSNVVYKRMVWVALALKCHVNSSKVTRSHEDIWEVIVEKQFEFSPENIADFRIGLHLTKGFNVPSSAMMSIEQMTKLACDKGEIRPLSHIANYVDCVAVFISDNEDFEQLLIQIYEKYVSFVFDNYFSSKSTNAAASKVSALSIAHTISGAIVEGLAFVDKSFDVLKQKDIREGFCNIYAQYWLTFLLHLVDVTKPGADEHLVMYFSRAKSQVLKKYYAQLCDDLIKRTRESFNELPCSQFFCLYKSLKLWPNKFAEEYFSICKIPNSIKVCDVELICEVVNRIPGAHNHHFLLNFIKNIGAIYTKECRSVDFILDMLAMKSPKLFALPNEECAPSVLVQKDFTEYLHGYILCNGLKNYLIRSISRILCSISEESEFQQFILAVLQKEVIPELKTLQSMDDEHMDVLTTATNILQKDLTWIQVLHPEQKFCLGIVATYCSKISTTIPTDDSLGWISSYFRIILQLGLIFTAYCKARNLLENERNIITTLPKDIAHHPNEDVHKFFVFIQKLQGILFRWKTKILHDKNCNYDDILLYALNITILLQIGDTLCVPSAIVDFETIAKTKDYFLELFEVVNTHMIKYIPGNALYCTLPQILQQYGVHFNVDFKKHLLLPNERIYQSEDQQLQNQPSSSLKGIFQPPCGDVSLLATKALTLWELDVVAHQLVTFIKPVIDHMHMLVFFTLHHCKIFHDHVHHELQKCCARSAELDFDSSSALSTLSMVRKQRDLNLKEEGTVSLRTLASALHSTKQFLIKLIQGTATYAEIITENGELKLETLDIEAEFNMLTAFINSTTGLAANSNHEGLKGIRCMLELFQYTSSHIPKIRDVCRQYKLEGCLRDECFKELVRTAEEIELNKANLIPLEAIVKVEHVKSLLCHKQSRVSDSVKLFSAVSNSAVFYQFVRDMKFDDDKGQEAFRLQCQLITNLLQHEEYNDTVLNHLLAAYNFIFPFMDTKQSFASLITRVTALDVSDMVLKPLETVNSNVSLIRLWFSRAEGDTLENVVRDLDCIIQTGQYEFEFSEDITISLQYCPSFDVVPCQVSSLEKISLQRQSDAMKMQRWSKVQIEDFVRKLGFLDAENEGGSMVKQFIHLNETTNKLYKLYSQLRALGCDGFIKGSRHITLPCSTIDPDKMVLETESKLSDWRNEVSKLYDRNKFMLFFHIPKLLLMNKKKSAWIMLSNVYEIGEHGDSTSMSEMFQVMYLGLSRIIENEVQLAHLKNTMTTLTNHYDWGLFFSKSYKELSDQIVTQVAQEISFLFHNNPIAFENIKKMVQAALMQSKKDPITSQNSMQAISVFLSTILLNHSLPTRIFTSKVAVSEECSQVLHVCPGFTQKDLISLILNIFGGLPEPFQVFRCQPSSTQGEIDLFLKRALKFAVQHLFLEVNKLPFHLQEHLVQFHFEMEHSLPLNTQPFFLLHYVETQPSILHNVPWVALEEYKEKPKSCMDVQSQLTPSLIQLVYGNAGDGKTHYIKQQLSQSPASCTICVNEAFTTVGAIKKLQQLPIDQKNCSIFLNFTMLPPVSDAEKEVYGQSVELISWFLFDLLILSYIEDNDSGLSFHLPGGMGWQIYVEVPSRELNITPDVLLELFCKDIPIASLIGTPYLIQNKTIICVNAEVQLVCKYLKAYKENEIDRLYKDGHTVKFSIHPDMADDICHNLLYEFMPEHIRAHKVTQCLFIKYMVNRCKFLDCLPAFNYNTGFGEYRKGERHPTDTRKLGSSLMKTMLKEVSDFCDPALQANWSINPHQQLIYDIKDGGGSVDLITLYHEKLSQIEVANFRKLGVYIPSMIEIHSRQVLDKYISKALDVPLDSAGRLKPIDDCGYVLTLDYAVKMLSIHERYRCGVPVIIEGETGVGKTALIQMLSVLWNHSLLDSWIKLKAHIHDFNKSRIGELPENSFDGYGTCMQLIDKFAAQDKSVTIEDMLILCNMPGSMQSPGLLYTKLREHLIAMRRLPVFALLVTKGEEELSTVFKDAESSNNLKTTAKLLLAVYYAQLEPTFYKLNIHAALTPYEIQGLLKPAFDQAKKLQALIEVCSSEKSLKKQPNANAITDKLPFITVSYIG